MQNIKYKKLCIRIAIAVLINTLLLQSISTVAYGIASSLTPFLRNFAREYSINSSDLIYAFEQTLVLFAYLISFLIPAFIFKFMIRNDDPEPIRYGIKLEPNTPLVIIGSIGIVIGAAYINSFMVSFIDFAPLFESIKMLSLAVAAKRSLGRDTRKAYLEGNKEALEALLPSYDKAASAVEDFYTAYEMLFSVWILTVLDTCGDVLLRISRCSQKMIWVYAGPEC